MIYNFSAIESENLYGAEIEVDSEQNCISKYQKEQQVP